MDRLERELGWVEGLRKGQESRMTDISVLRDRVTSFSEPRKQSLDTPVSGEAT